MVSNLGSPSDVWCAIVAHHLLLLLLPPLALIFGRLWFNLGPIGTLVSYPVAPLLQSLYSLMRTCLPISQYTYYQQTRWRFRPFDYNDNLSTPEYNQNHRLVGTSSCFWVVALFLSLQSRDLYRSRLAVPVDLDSSTYYCKSKHWPNFSSLLLTLRLVCMFTIATYDINVKPPPARVTHRLDTHAV